MMIWSTLSARLRRKSSSPLFASSSAMGSLSSVIGVVLGAWVKRATPPYPMVPVATAIDTARDWEMPHPRRHRQRHRNYTTSSDATHRRALVAGQLVRLRPVESREAVLVGHLELAGGEVERRLDVVDLALGAVGAHALQEEVAQVVGVGRAADVGDLEVAPERSHRVGLDAAEALHLLPALVGVGQRPLLGGRDRRLPTRWARCSTRGRPATGWPAPCCHGQTRPQAAVGHPRRRRAGRPRGCGP